MSRRLGRRIAGCCLWAVVGAIAVPAADDVVLTVAPGAVPGEVELSWTGGDSLFSLYRSEDPTSVVATGTLITTTDATTWLDTPPSAPITYYQVLGLPDPPVVYRLTEIALREPHVFTPFSIFCVDSTDVVNDNFSEALNGDDDNDGLLDLSLVAVVDDPDPLAPGGLVELAAADCTEPAETTFCTLSTVQSAGSYSNVDSGACLTPRPGTINPSYQPPPTFPTAPPTCLLTEPLTITLNVAGTPVTLRDARVSANWMGAPPDVLANGVIEGFITEADAETTFIDTGIAGILPLSALLPGHPDGCSTTDDRDLGDDGTTPGWWLYFNFEASEVPYLP